MKVIVVEDSLFNGISEKGFFKKHNVEVKNVLGGTIVPDEADTLLVQKPDCIIMYGGTKGINTLNKVEKIERKAKNSLPNTRLAFFR